MAVAGPVLHTMQTRVPYSHPPTILALQLSSRRFGHSGHRKPLELVGWKAVTRFFPHKIVNLWSAQSGKRKTLLHTLAQIKTMPGD